MKRIILFISQISGGLLRIDKHEKHIWINFPWAVLIHFPGACLFTFVRSENDEAATIRLAVKNMTSIHAA